MKDEKCVYNKPIIAKLQDEKCVYNKPIIAKLQELLFTN
jgi:hypothetical protein